MNIVTNMFHTAYTDALYRLRKALVIVHHDNRASLLLSSKSYQSTGSNLDEFRHVDVVKTTGFTATR